MVYKIVQERNQQTFILLTQKRTINKKLLKDVLCMYLANQMIFPQPRDITEIDVPD